MGRIGMSSIHLEEFHGLKCSRPNCGGDAEIYVVDEESIEIRCMVCTNRQELRGLSYDPCPHCILDTQCENCDEID